VIVNVLLAPDATVTVPEGEIIPPVPAEALMVYEVLLLAVKLAEIVWFAVTLLKVYEVTAPTDDPSTRTLETR
jgi:hypothetical protein